MDEQSAGIREVISLKQELLRQAPYSGARYGGKDVVFFMKIGQPGTDAFLYDDGTIMKRQFFGDEKKMRRYGSFKKSKENLEGIGYRPYNLFAPDGTLMRYEAEHEAAKVKTASARSFFPTVEKVKFKPQSRLGYDQVVLKQPVFYGQQQPMNYEAVSYPTQQTKPTPQNNNDAAYQQLFKNINDFGRRNISEGRIVVPKTNRILTGGQFATWAQKELSAVTRRTGTGKRDGTKKPDLDPSEKAKKLEKDNRILQARLKNLKKEKEDDDQ